MSNDPDRIRREIEMTRNDLSTGVDALADKVNPRRIAGDRVEQARGAVGRARERVMGTSTSVKERTMGASAHLGDGGRVSHAAASARAEARSLGRQTREQAQGNPLAAGLIAFGAGLLVASLVPSSRSERQWAGQARGMVSEHSDQLREQAGQVGNQMRDNLRRPAQQAAQSVRSTAAGGASAVREQGVSAAQQVRGQAHVAADDLRR